MAKEANDVNAQKLEKLKILQSTLDKIEKSYGKGSIMKLGDRPNEELEVISTGSISLDNALGVGGFPRGRVIEIYGPESSGKTTLAIHAIAECQKQGGIAAFIDAEHAFDSFYAKKLGVDVDNLLVSQPDNGEQALEIADNLIRSGAIDIIVIDSVAALTPKAEIDGDMGDSKVGLQARLMSQAMRKLTATISKTNCCCIFINQLREKIGVLFGNPETTTGGNALKFYASVRVDIRRTQAIKDGDQNIGNRVKVRIDITCDRHMEYLELIDGRPSCVEPLSTEAGWRWNDGLRYYITVGNTDTRCYIDRLEKGRYWFEYEVYVTNPGTFLSGPVTMQCMYAPEFRATAPAQTLHIDPAR